MRYQIRALSASFLFSWLFYGKSFGINVLLMALIVVVLLCTVRNWKTIPWRYAIAYLFTAIMVFMDASSFHILVHLLCFAAFIGTTVTVKTSLYIATFIGFVQSFFGYVLDYITLRGKLKTVRPGTTKNSGTYVLGAAISILAICLFTWLYSTANPVFEALVQQVDFSVLSLPRLVFTLLGYLLFLNIGTSRHLEELVAFDTNCENALKAPDKAFLSARAGTLKKEYTVGTMVLGVLNVLLLLFLTTDVIYLTGLSISDNAAYSSSVHQGVYALVFSIVMAIGTILYFFRGNLNFFNTNGALRKLTYTWLVCNLILVLTTWYKNWMYVAALGLTYKRIGVFVYLLLTVSGLITTYVKVAHIRSFWYLVRSNTVVFFSVLVLATGVPWDRTITWYNLNQVARPDIAYLLGLKNGHLPQLFRYGKAHSDRLMLDQQTAINERYTDFVLAEKEKTWQEYTWYQLVKKQ